MQMCDSFIWWLPPIRCGGGDASAGLLTYQEIQEWLGKLQAQCKYFTATQVVQKWEDIILCMAMVLSQGTGVVNVHDADMMMY
jgi:hypothetical protein